ncbi:Fatty acyl-CoA reductase 1 [Hibiscus syriacus]|uniref:Fatty acyl-CoA reductase n=1 Tax=Hibiscus syriacus TaxID=106335 RepID=A0A6A3BRN6_HIBSY|nr:fatty acyl-CoA reductase 3-like [Hibiscus syriacus]KAE8719516.1 Fatty acyl-CoA reductase 1 [Hibiscus syriacus]
MEGKIREDEEFQIPETELDHVAKFLQGKTILITGATGFLAKVFIEEILRHQPNVNKLYLIMRASDDKSAIQRLYDEVISTELFRVLHETWGSKFDRFISSKVIAIAGDISFENLGVKDFILREEIQNEIEIIVNVAATTSFSERYDVALDINTFGTFNVLNFGKKCDKLKLFIHVSTAYVCGEQAGMISEKPFYMGETLRQTSNLDIFDEKRIMEEKLDQLRQQCSPNETITRAMKELGFTRAKSNGWPNTYVFTKAMGEMLLGKFKGDVPLVVIRPSMISSTYKQPFPGWIEGIRTFDSIVVRYGQGTISCFLGNPSSPLDLVPVDMVVNAMLVAMEVHFADNQTSSETIYHVSSSFRNPLRYSDLRKFAYCYFSKNPCTDRNGKKVKVGKPTVFDKADKFFLYMRVKYVLPLKVLYLMNKLSCQRSKETHTKLDRKVKSVIRLAQFYKPYAFFAGIFDCSNLEELQRVAEERGIDVAKFNFDSKYIDWEDYIMNIHIPGLLKHAVRT